MMKFNKLNFFHKLTNNIYNILFYNTLQYYT